MTTKMIDSPCRPPPIQIQSFECSMQNLVVEAVVMMMAVVMPTSVPLDSLHFVVDLGVATVAVSDGGLPHLFLLLLLL